MLSLAAATLLAAAPPAGTVLLRVVRPETGAPVAGAALLVLSGEERVVAQATTGKNGTVRLSLPEGHYAATPAAIEDYLDGIPEGAMLAQPFQVRPGAETPVTLRVGKGASLIARTVFAGRPAPRAPRSTLECAKGGPRLDEQRVRIGQPTADETAVVHRGVRPGKRCTLTVRAAGVERVLGPFDVRGGMAVLELITPPPQGG